MNLRDYQSTAVSCIEREHETVRSTLLHMATGLGKTPTLMAACRRVVARGGRCLVIAHRAELLAQAAATARAFGLTVGIECAGERVDQSNLPDVVVASVQTLRSKRLEVFAPDAFALIVVDEAHHATAKSYRIALDYFAGAKVLGCTATPQRGDGTGLNAVFESVAFTMDLRAGIEQGWLCPLELRSVVVQPLDISSVRSVAGDLHAGQLEDELLRDAVLHGIARPLSELSAGRQTLAFVVGVAQAHALSDTLRGYGVHAAAVDGSMSADDRARVLSDYRSGRTQIVCNAMLWTEGFDAPETSCIALVRPTRSRSLLIQQIGRGTRKADCKDSCLVLDFVPGRLSKVRLASPADALAGEELDADVLAAVREASAGSQLEMFGAIRMARIEVAAAKAAERAERKERLRQLDVIYEVARLDLATLLEVAEPEPTGARDASMYQIDALRKAGLNVRSDISRTSASKLLDMVQERRRAGLCSIKQARKLRAYGLRDDIRFDAARSTLDVIAGYGWRPPTLVVERLRARLVDGGVTLQPNQVAPLSEEAATGFQELQRRVQEYVSAKERTW